MGSAAEGFPWSVIRDGRDIPHGAFIIIDAEDTGVSAISAGGDEREWIDADRVRVDRVERVGRQPRENVSSRGRR